MRTIVHEDRNLQSSHNRKIIYLFVSFVTVMLSAVTTFMLIKFLSFHNVENIIVRQPPDEPELFWIPFTKTQAVWLGLLVNFVTFSAFVLQHSLMARETFTIFMKQKGLRALQRSIYIICSCVALQLLMYCWYPITSYTLWEINTQENPLLWWLFTSVHLLAWISIYGCCLILDIGELLGVKQVYYQVYRSYSPYFYKSTELCGLYKNMRHPGLLPFIVLLWCHPIMSLDRTLLSVLWIAYVIVGFDVQHSDYVYCKVQLEEKKMQLYHTS